MPKNLDVFKNRRQYNKWVADETLEDYALRFTAKKARRWSTARIANTALGTVSFLVLETLGGSITLHYGFTNAVAAILVVCAILFISGIPISYYAAKYGVDIDLLTRGAGFGYIGSTISSLIYASFTFIFFALEAVLMSRALEILFGIPLYIAYIISALVVIPLVTHGISLIGRFQYWSQPLWLILQFISLFFLLRYNFDAFNDWTHYPGQAATADSTGNSFNLLLFGASTAVLFALMAQIGEQVDFLRFLPEPTPKTKKWWWSAVIFAGPGWAIVGALKLLLGSFLAFLLIREGFSYTDAIDPTHMYTKAFSYITQSPDSALIIAGIFVIISQLKINVANAYAGSLAWSNFFSRITHYHPGRVVWVYFNVAIALLLMEIGLYAALESILHTYSALVLAWFGSIVADLVINKPLKLAPPGIEYKRATLYDINPVGVGSMLIASSVGIASSFGLFGELAKALSAFIAFLLPFLTAPLIAYLSKGRYYFIQKNIDAANINSQAADSEQQTCILCQNDFDHEDMSSCPAYDAPICSLCCALDSRCEDQCRPEGTLQHQFHSVVGKYIPIQVEEKLPKPFMAFLSINAGIYLAIAAIFALVIYKATNINHASDFKQLLLDSYLESFLLLSIVIGIITWLYVLSRHNHKMVLKESRQQMHLLKSEIHAHTKTAEQLKQAKTNADDANTKKSRYVTALSHELRTPLNAVLGYAQLLENDEKIDHHYKDYISTIRRSGDQLEALVESLLEISKIEAGKIELHKTDINLLTFLDNLQSPFEAQAKKKGIHFKYEVDENLPAFIHIDAQKLRQILNNLLSNAIKFTDKGEVSLVVSYKFQIASFTISDTGPGMSVDDQDAIFDPFHRASNTANAPGLGLGLTISRLLSEMMGGAIEVESHSKQGSSFTLKLMLSNSKNHIDNANELYANRRGKIKAYKGVTKHIIIVDDDSSHRQLIQHALKPLGFDLIKTSSAEECLDIVDACRVDLFLLDISLPDMSGWQLLQTLRNKGFTQPVIMVSANAYALQPQDSKSKKPHMQHNDFMTKPVHLNELIERIGKQLHLEWIYKELKEVEPQNHDRLQLSDTQKTALLQALEIGNLTAFLTQLDIVEQDTGKHAALEALRTAAKQFQYTEAISLLNSLDA